MSVVTLDAACTEQNFENEEQRQFFDIIINNINKRYTDSVHRSIEFLMAI
jgi:hypothetical protein